MKGVAAAAVLLALGIAPASAAATGSVAGHVTDPRGAPIQDICVDVYALAGFTHAATGLTDQGGDYLIEGLTAGDYAIEFSDASFKCPESGDFYLAEWFNGKPNGVTADPVTVTDGATTTGIDAVLAEPEGIGGRVTDSSGTPLQGICIAVGLASGGSGSGPPPGFGQTAATGDYFIAVPAGEYKVSFFDGGFPCDRDKYEGQYYNDKPGSASADVVIVATGRTTFGINAVLWEYTRIKGHVQDEAGQPLDGICVVAQNTTVLSETGQPPGFARTNAAGDYVMGIAPGDYKVSFYDNGVPCSVGKYVGQWFNGRADYSSADVVHVSRGATVAGIDARMKLFQLVQPLPVATPIPPAAPRVRCRVPKLRGIQLRRAKVMLRTAHCRLGTVSRKRAKPKLVGRVMSSKPRAGAVKPAGTRVRVVVGRRR